MTVGLLITIAYLGFIAAGTGLICWSVIGILRAIDSAVSA